MPPGALLTICLQGVIWLSDKNATWLLERSPIGTNPPNPPHLDILPTTNSTGEGSLIWYDAKNETSIRKWTDLLDKSLEVYRTPGLTPGRGENIYDCDYDRQPGPGQVCDVDVRRWRPCTQENNYNFHKSAPCIFLKLNEIYGWEPEFYNNTETLPEEMPTGLIEYIKYIASSSANQRRLNTIWVSCDGASPADVENIGPMRYYPQLGFPGYFYPYMNTEGYLSPLVAVHFERPRTGVRINVECKAWARNIVHSRTDRLGSVHFELMID